MLAVRCCSGFSLVAARGGYPLEAVLRLLVVMRWLLLQSTGFRHTAFSSCSTGARWLQLLGPRAQAQEFWCSGLVALKHVRSPWIRD